MKVEDLNLNDSEKKVLLERLKDLRVSSPSTQHPTDRNLEKLGLVTIKNGLTTFVGDN